MNTAAALVLCAASGLAQQPTPSLPDAPGKDTVQRVCGACHPASVVLARGRTKDEWNQTVASMISRGAKGTPTDFATVTDYLVKNVGPGYVPAAGGARRRHALGAGPTEKQVVDEAAAARGETLYKARCESCHGALARGGNGGPDLVRSDVVLHDMYAKQLTPYMRDKHPAGAGVQGLTDAQISDLSHYLHQQVDDTLRSGPYTKVINVLTGSAQAGEQYFDGAGGCTGCHSASGDLAHIADRYDAPTLQQRMLFPRVPAPGRRGVMAAEKPVTAKITTSDGETVSGTLVRMDDFNVALRDGNGVYHSWTRTPSLQVTLDDPYQAHHELLDKITDKEIHDLVAYLETLK